MTTFDKREESFEQKYAHEEELRFVVRWDKAEGKSAAATMSKAGRE